uniref:Secreted protein n=1 Tax=Achlya hypogyna TaxID=1202772 RepID=A0A0A7CNT9_ACHHY|nr:secreted protein [Achlya hypogyna]
MVRTLLLLAASAFAAPAVKPVSDLASRFGFNATVENADNCREYYADFTNSASHPGWGDFQGHTAAGPGGFRIFNNDKGGSRIRFDWDFNAGEAVSYVAVTMRGAPDTGKNSYAILREPKCQDDLNKHNCDEIDMAEVWGWHQIVDAHSFLYNPSVSDYDYASPTPVFTVTSNANNQQHTYGLELRRGGKYWMRFNNQDVGGGWTQGPYAHSMKLYLGIWDCSTDFGGVCGPYFNQESWMEVKSVWIKQCW